MVALHAGNALIALTLPLANRIEFIPSGHQLRLLLRYTELVSIAHVKLGTGNGTARPGRWLGQLIPEVDLHRALTVLLVSIVPLAVHTVAAVAVHLTNRRLQVVQVGFDGDSRSIWHSFYARRSASTGADDQSARPESRAPTRCTRHD